MLVADSPTAEDSQTPAALAPSREVTLANGQPQSLEGLSASELQELQWDQEQQFAAAMKQAPRGSDQRVAIVGQAYDTVCAILSAQQTDDQPLVMGLDARYIRLVLSQLNRQVRQGMGQPRLFEVGYGSGMMLKEARDRGFPVGGIEVSSTMRDEAIGVLGENFADQLLLGDLRSVEKDSLSGRPSLIYWNDVFEHICPDEIEDYLAKIYELLAPEGVLITITPNWLLRPSDVTGDFCPLRTEARGLHLKEYRLAEVSHLLKKAGFRRVATPLVVTKKRIITCGSGLRLAKQLVEPLFDRLPVRPAHLLCRGFGMSCTLATK
ncbi:MAG: class I SAM-dependent methyltransferase [Planctomycetes bacterium]|nr:class I SAM-dependent methyltransferase [Planctomycetota bacterium]